MTLLDADPGSVFLPATLERAVCETLREWMPFYLSRVDEQEGLDPGTTHAPRFYDAASDDERRWQEEVPPAVLVISPGTTGDPELHGNKAEYGAWWQVNIAVTAGGATEAGARDLASRLGGAIVFVVAQQGDFGETVTRTKFLGIRIDKLDRERAKMIAEVVCECWIPDMVSTRGPLKPLEAPTDPTDPAPPIPQPDSVSVSADFDTP
jgi:hypothetical protein